MDPLITLFAATAGYLFGSISFARLVTRRVAPGKEIGLWQQPVPNSSVLYEDDAVSATWVNLNLSPRYGCLTAVLDMLKAVLPMLAFRLWMPEQPYFLAVSAGALVGHDWPLYHRFQGGRGESVVWGSMLVVDPLGALLVNLAATLLGLLFGSVHLLRWSGVPLLIPWLWIRTGDVAYLAYSLFVNLVFWISMRKDVRQFYTFHKQGFFHTQEELSTFLDMGGHLGRFMDRYSLPALLKR